MSWQVQKEVDVRAVQCWLHFKEDQEILKVAMKYVVQAMQLGALERKLMHVDQDDDNDT